MRYALVVFVLVVGCGKSAKKSPGADELTAVRDKMCACKDAQCVGETGKAFEQLYKKYEISKDKQLDTLATTYEGCRQAAAWAFPPPDEQLIKFAEVAERGCACSDKACFDKALEELDERFPYWTNYAYYYVSGIPVDNEGLVNPAHPQVQKWTELFMKLKNCATRFYPEETKPSAK